MLPPLNNCDPGDEYYESESRFDLYGALWLFCSEGHSGMGSRGYRILSRLSKAGYVPGLSLQRGEFESDAQREIYYTLVHNHLEKI